MDGEGNNSQIGNLTLGTVQWEVGAVSDLPLEWDIITYTPGYAQPTTEQIIINIKVRVKDEHGAKDGGPCENICIAQAKIPVTVT